MPFFIAQSATFLSERLYRPNTKTNSLSISFAQLTSFAKVYKKISEIQNNNAQSLEFRKTFDLIKQIEEISDPYWANNSELSDMGVLKNVLHGYHAATLSRANLQISLKTIQHSSNEMQSAVAKLKQNSTNELFSKIWHENCSIFKNSYISNIKEFFCNDYDYLPLKKIFYS